MTIRTMRFLDRYLGIPLCWILGPFLRVVRMERRRSNQHSAKRILVIKLFGLGSIVLATPALTLIRNAFPTSRITFLTFEENRELAERLPLIDEVITIRRMSFFAFIGGTIRTVNRFFFRPFDVVYDFEFFSKYSTLLAGLSLAPTSVAFALPTRWKSLFLTHQAPIDKTRHVTSSFCALVRCHTHTSADVPPVTPPMIAPDDHAALLAKFHLHANPLVCINVNAGVTFPERRWPAEFFAELVSRMAQERDCQFCFIGTYVERRYVERIIARTRCQDRCINTCGLLTIPELGAMFQRCEFVLSNDSGPLHLAAALGIPTIGLYGPESPAFYGPVSESAATVYKNISCSPCMNVYSAKDFRCPFNARCMREISVEEVFDNIHSVSEVVS